MTLYIGGSAGGTVAFNALSTPVREPTNYTYYPYAEAIQTVGGTVVGRGAPYAEMYWRAITRPERNKLRTFCTGPSATAYIYAPENDNKTYHLFSATMVWPTEEKYRYGKTGDDIIEDFKLVFRKLVVQ